MLLLSRIEDEKAGLLAEGGPVMTNDGTMTMMPAKKHKTAKTTAVDRRASKGRKIRYAQVHQLHLPGVEARAEDIGGRLVQESVWGVSKSR